MNFKTAPADILIFLLVLFTLPPLTGCSNTAGAVSETTNGAVSTVFIGENNEVIKDAEITLTTRNFLYEEENQLSLTCTLQADGSFSFKDLPSGEYNIHITNEHYNSLIKTTYDSVADTFSNINDSTYLTSSGSFSGEVLVTERIIGETLFVRPEGLNLFATVNEYGKFSFPHLPAGNISFQVSKKAIGDFGPSMFDSFQREIKSSTLDTSLQILPNSNYNKEFAIIRNIYDINGYREKTVLTNYPKSSISFKNLALDTLPALIGQLEIPIIFLSNNNLTSIPKEIFSNPKLEKLVLSHNKLTTLPQTISNALKLKELSVDSNTITSLPEAIILLDSLTIDINNNKLSGLSTKILEWLHKHSKYPDWETTQD